MENILSMWSNNSFYLVLMIFGKCMRYEIMTWFHWPTKWLWMKQFDLMRTYEQGSLIRSEGVFSMYKWNMFSALKECQGEKKRQ